MIQPSNNCKTLLTPKWHMEDLDNRRRHHNIRVRGSPETIENKQIAKATIVIFNDLFLGRPPENAHRVRTLVQSLRTQKQRH